MKKLDQDMLVAREEFTQERDRLTEHTVGACTNIIYTLVNIWMHAPVVSFCPYK